MIVVATKSVGTCCSSSAVSNLNGSVAAPFVIPSVPGFPTSPLSLVTTYVVLSKEDHTRLTEAATLDRKSREAEGSAVQRTRPGNVFPVESVPRGKLNELSHPRRTSAWRLIHKCNRGGLRDPLSLWVRAAYRRRVLDLRSRDGLHAHDDLNHDGS